MGYSLYIAGARGTRTICGAEFLEFGGETSCYLITNGSYALVIDCGSGLSNIKERIKDCTKIDVILTHIHYDHIMGLLDFGVFPKGVKPRVYGTFTKWNMFGKRRAFTTKPYWPVPIQYEELIDVEWGEERIFGSKISAEKKSFSDNPVNIDNEKENECLENEYQEDIIKVKFYEANHPDFCSMIRLEIKSETTGLVSKKIMLMCDYEHGKPIPKEIIEPFDYLIYDGTYFDEEYEKYKGYGHSTIEQGILLAKKMGVKQLILTHHDPVKNDEVLNDLEKKAKENFHNVCLARRGDEILL